MNAKFRLSVAACLFCAIASILDAQVLTSTVIGKVTDESGLPMPGATIAITSPQMIKAQEIRVTNTQGEYRATALPPGTYTITFEMSGFGTIVREGIVLASGATIAVDAVMRVASVEQTVTVVGRSPMVDVASTKVGTTLNSEQLANIPTARTYNALLATAPGVTLSTTTAGASPTYSVLGSAVVSNTYLMDGLDISDPYSNTPNLFLPQDMFQEVQVNTAGFSAEFGNVEGGVFNFVTKSGSNEWTGDTSYYVQDKSLQSNNIDASLRDQGVKVGTATTKLGDFSASIGGPLMKDRLWIYATGRYYDAKNTVAGFTAQTQDVWHAPAFVKGTSQLTSGNRLEVGYQHRNGSYFPENASLYTNDDPRTWRRWNQNENTLNANYTSVLSDRTVVTARVGFARHNRGGEFPNSDDKTGQQDMATGVRCCGWITLQGMQWRRGTRANASLSHFAANLLGGSHQLKTGFEADFNQGGRDSIWPEDMFMQTYNGAPYRVVLYNTPRIGASDNVTIYSGYAQDEWSIKRVTINPGLRFDHSEAWLPAQSSPGGKWFGPDSYSEMRGIVNIMTVSPRIGFVVDIIGNHKSIFKASYGRYDGSMRTQNIPNPNSSGAQTWTWKDLNGDNYFEAGEQGTLISDTTGGAAYAKVDPNLKTPRTDAYTIEFEYQMREDLALSVTATYKKGKNFGSTVYQNIPYSAYNPVTTTDPLTGQPITFYVLQPAYRGLKAIQYLTNPTDMGAEQSRYKGVEFLVRKRMSAKWQLQASLNLSKSEDNFTQGILDSLQLLASPRAAGGNRSNPNSMVNAFGRSQYDRPFLLKLMGSYLMPHGVMVSGSLLSMSGLPYARIVRFLKADFPQMVVESYVDVWAEPNGTERYHAMTALDLRAEKQFEFGGRRLGVMADVFNVMNGNTVASYTSTNVSQKGYESPNDIQPPRALRLGIRFSF